MSVPASRLDQRQPGTDPLLAAARFALEIAGCETPERASRHAARAARRLVRCDVAVLETARPGARTATRHVDGRPAALAALPAAQDAIAAAFRQAVDTAEPVVVASLPATAPDAVASDAVASVHAPLRSAVVLPMARRSDSSSMLALLSRSPAFFEAERADVARVFVEHAAVALSEVANRSAAENLRDALRTSREIATAVGIVMSACKLKQSAAFELIAHYSQEHHVKVRDIAAQIVYTGQPPAPGARA